MMESLIRVDEEKLVIDLEKHYKNSKEVLTEMNEAKLESPVILVDPTYKARNALAGLSTETFKKFLEETKRFLKNPKEEYFEEKRIIPEALKKEAKKKKAEYTRIIITTNKQEGDIAGTKMLKFSKFLKEKLSYSSFTLKAGAIILKCFLFTNHEPLYCIADL